MNQTLPYPLWLGHSGEGSDFRQIFDTGIKALVQVSAENTPPQAPRELICCHFPLLDGVGNRAELLFLAISCVATLLKMRLPTLLCCDAGASRAPAIAAAALAIVHHETPEACLSRVVQHHRSDVSPGLWNEVTGVLATARDKEFPASAESAEPGYTPSGSE